MIRVIPFVSSLDLTGGASIYLLGRIGEVDVVNGKLAYLKESWMGSDASASAVS